MKVYTKITSSAKKTASRYAIYQQNLEKSKIYYDRAERRGVYRTGRKKLTHAQKKLKKRYFDGYTFQYMVTIRMPYRSEEGYNRTKDYSVALKKYRTILKRFQECLRGNNWKRHPLHIVWVLENGKDETGCDSYGYYHIHILILKTTNTMKEIIDALQEVEDIFDLGGKGIELDEIYCEKGAVLYVLKEQGYDKGSHEFCDVFNTMDICKKSMPRKYLKRKKLSVKTIKKYIICIKKKIVKTVVKLTQNLLYNSFYGIYT